MRIVWVDYAKVVGIALVVFAHCYNHEPVHSWFYHCIYAFHMPLFFFLSGYLLHFSGSMADLRAAGRDLLKAFRTLGVPLLAFNTLFYVRDHGAQLGSDPFGAVGDYGVQLWDSLLNRHPFMQPVMWYLCVLLLLRVILLGVHYCSHRPHYKWMVCGVAVMWMIVAEDVSILRLKSCALALPFYLGGFYVRREECRLRSWIGKWVRLSKFGWAWVATAGLVVVCATLVRWNGEVNIHKGLFGASVSLFYLNAAVGIGWVWACCRCATRCPPLIATTAAATMLILGVHYPIAYNAYRMMPVGVVEVSGGATFLSACVLALFYVGVTVLVLWTCRICNRVLLRWVPFIVGR